MISENKSQKYTLILIFSTAFIRLIIAAFTGLGIGESYYARGVLEPSLSYFDQPPLFFWLSWLTTKIFGFTSFGLRLPAVLLFGGSSWFLYLFTKKFFGSAAGFYAAVLLNLSAVFTISVGAWFQPDAPLMFFWLVSAYSIAFVLFPEKELSPSQVMLRWVWVGLAMGFTTLSKYHVVFLLAGVFLFCVFQPKYRKWLTHPGPYLALGINLLFSLPVILWNSQHEWVSFVFQGSRAGSGGAFKLHFLWFFRSILGQAIWLLPWIWVPLMLQLPKAWKQGEEILSYRFIFWISILPIAFFSIITLWSNLGFHFHWQAPGYLMLFSVLGDSIARNINGTEKRKMTLNWLWASSFFTIFSLSLLAAHSTTGFWQWYGPKYLTQKFGGKTDPTMEGYDYDDLKHYFEKKGWLQDTSLFLGTPNWWFTGKIDWALKCQKDIIVFHDDPRNYAFFMKPQEQLGKNAIIVTQTKSNSTIDNLTKPYFDNLRYVDSVAITRGGVAELYVHVHKAENFKIPDNPLSGPLYNLVRGRPPFSNN